MTRGPNAKRSSDNDSLSALTVSVTTRSARFEDIDAMVDLLEDLFSIEKDFTFDEEKQRKGLKLLITDDRCCVLVAERQQNVVGMCTVQKMVSTAEGANVGLVEDLIVDKQERGYGIGKKLLFAIGEWARRQGLTRLQLLADHTNQSTLNFYGLSGWNKTGLLGLRKELNDHT